MEEPAGLVSVSFTVWMLIYCLKNDPDRYLWMWVILFFPSLGPIPESFVAIGMAAFFAAVVRAPITAIVLVLEMTGDFHQLLPLITGALFAMVVAERLGTPPM